MDKGLVYKYDSYFIKKNRKLKSLRKAEYRNDHSPLDNECECHTCQNYSKAYLHHLLREKELLGMHLLSLHNICFMINFMKRIREEIEQGNILNFKRELEKIY